MNHLLAFLLGMFLVCIGIGSVYASDCESSNDSLEETISEDINSDVPRGLEGARIIVRRADGSESSVPIEKFKVVPRVQQFIARKVTITEKLVCKERIKSEDSNNTIIIGARKDYKKTEVETDGKTANVSIEKGLVPDINYLRRNVLGPIGIGAGVDTNGTVKGNLGIDF